MTDLALSCSCGAVRGRVRDVSPRRGMHVVCYCDDCQCFAHHIGTAAQTLDDAGGTELYQTTPAQVTIDEGAEHVACVRLSPKGLLRFHTTCCGTPVGNQVDMATLAFIGIPRAFIATEDLDAAVGPVRGGVHGRFARGGCPPNAHPKLAPSMMLPTLGMLLGNTLARRAQPSPTRTSSGELRVTPVVLTRDQRDALRAKLTEAE